MTLEALYIIECVSTFLSVPDGCQEDELISGKDGCAGHIDINRNGDLFTFAFTLPFLFMFN